MSRGREDDKQDVIEKRFEAYMDNNRDVINFYRKLGVYVEVNGNQDITSVFNDVVKVLK